jgi:YegS/Rv2252/BmrU family lipid kinase
LKQRILFIINPNSGHKRGAKIIDMLPEYLDSEKFDYSHVLTTHAGHAIDLSAQAVIDKMDIVVAVGGDGLVNEAFQSLVNTEVAFTIIPRGSGNGVARSIGVDMNIRKALSNLNNGMLSKMDTVTFNGKPYLGVAGIGFDGLIAWEFSKTIKRGMFTYVKIILKHLAAFQSNKYRVITDQGEHEFDAFIMTIANTPQYGNDAFIAPNAEINNGQLDLVVVKKHAKWLLPILAFQVMTGRIHKSKYVEVLRASQFSIQTSFDQSHVDGEPILSEKDNIVSVLPRSLNIFS